MPRFLKTWLAAAAAAGCAATPVLATIATTTMHTGGQLISGATYVKGGTDLASNGSISLGFNAWTISGPAGINMDSAPAEPPSLHIGNDAGDDASAYQTISLPAGVPILADFWIGNKSGTIDAGLIPVVLRVYNTDGDRLGEVYKDTEPHGPGWHHCVADLSPYAGQTVRLSFEARGFTICLFGCARAPAAQFDLDDVRILSGPEALYCLPGAQMRLYPLVYYVGGPGEQSGYDTPEGTYYRVAPSTDNVLYQGAFSVPSSDGPQTLSWYSYHKGIFEPLRSLTARVDGTAPLPVLRLGGTVSLAGGTQKLANPSFETAGGWSFTNKAGITTADAHSGTRSAVASSTSSFSQSVALSGGSEPVLSFWSNGDRASAANLLITSPSGQVLFSRRVGGGSWRQTILSLSALAGRTVTLVFEGIAFGSAMLFDDITLLEGATANVAPGSAHTFEVYETGSGLDVLQFADNGGAPQQGSGLAVTAPGAHQIAFSATDILGHSRSGVTTLNVDAGPIEVWQVKQAATGSHVQVANKVVTGVFGVVGSNGVFYVADQASPHVGIGVTAAILPPVSPGDVVTLSGTTSLDKGELTMALGTFTHNVGNVALTPSVFRGADLGGAAFGNQPGIEGASGCNTVGTLVRAVGKVTAVVDGNSALYIDDGSGAGDGSGSKGVRVQLNGAAARPAGAWLEVTGISGVRVVNAKLQRVLNVRFASDVQDL